MAVIVNLDWVPRSQNHLVEITCSQSHILCSEILHNISLQKGIPKHMVSFTHHGRIIQHTDVLRDGDILHAFLRLPGGKGGFGSMLRAIGAQIEKTTNREACRDLSGRRLRDINEEKRLKQWLAKQAEREKEAYERKKRKLEQMCEEPRHTFHDPTYDKETAEIREKVFDAVEKGMQASASTSGTVIKKRKTDSEGLKSKKKDLWLDIDEDEFSDSSEDSDTEKEETNRNEQKDNSVRSNEYASLENEDLSDNDNKSNTVVEVALNTKE